MKKAKGKDEKTGNLPKKKEWVQKKHLIPGANKHGRPKGVLNFKTRLTMAIDALAEEYVARHNANPDNKDKKIRVADVDFMGDIFRQYVLNAKGGDQKAIDSLLDRAYGKATQPVELSGKQGGPIETKIVEDRAKRARQILDRWVKKKTDGNSRPKRQ